jgi:hypothetical protein
MYHVSCTCIVSNVPSRNTMVGLLYSTLAKASLCCSPRDRICNRQTGIEYSRDREGVNIQKTDTTDGRSDVK